LTELGWWDYNRLGEVYAQGHRVDEILQQIAHLEPEEQRQLLERLPAVLLCSAEELGWLQVAEPAFGFWDNPEDARYDQL
jgi:hypothetical protein